MCRDSGFKDAQHLIENIHSVLLPAGVLWIASSASPDRREPIFKSCPWEQISVSCCAL